MKSLVTKAVACMGLSACLMFSGIGSASASDGWNIVTQQINGLTGTSKCSISASTPVRQSNLMAGSGAVHCNEPYMRIELTICMQTKQPLVDDASWTEVSCAPAKIVENSQGTTNTHTIQCLPTQMLYRTQTQARGYQINDTTDDPTFNMVIQSSAVAQTCGI